MRHFLSLFLVPLLTLPALGEDKPTEKPPTPAEEYKALLQDYQKEQQAYIQALRTAKTTEERDKVAKEKAPNLEKYAGRFLEFAKKSPKDTTAVDALAWVVINGRLRAAKDAGEALDLLQKSHLTDPRMATVCQSLLGTSTPATEEFLRSVLEQTMDHKAQGI